MKKLLAYNPHKFLIKAFEVSYDDKSDNNLKMNYQTYKGLKDQIQSHHQTDYEQIKSEIKKQTVDPEQFEKLFKESFV